ncbi:HD-GYP domain-containing protein, partial [Methylicorpusculum sp.]
MNLRKLWPFRKKNKGKSLDKDGLLSSAERVLTPVSQLTIGMYVIELDRPWIETKFIFQGFEIRTDAEIKQLKETCEFVYIDLTKNKKRRPVKIESGTDKAPESYDFDAKPPPKKGNFEKEIKRADLVYRQTGQLVSEFMERIAHGGGVDSKIAKEAVSHCVNSILHSPDAILWLSQLKNRDAYTAQHSLNVCMLSIVLGRHLNLSEANLNNVGLCGMMHDMGKMRVPLEILNKPGKLDPDEMEIMQSHPLLGYELLRSSPGMYYGAVESAYSHHERLDGSGYPRRINRTSLSLFTKIVTIVDMYDAITSDRVYQKGRTHLEATHIMSNLVDVQLERDLVIKFIECIGVYPPGAVVMMTNRAVAIVVEVNEVLKLRPKVMLLLDEDHYPVPEQVIDLSLMPTDDYGNVYTIKG